LEQHPGECPETGGAVLARVQPGERDATREAPAMEVRDEATGRAQQGRLAVAREARQQAELPGADLDADVAEGGPLDTGVAVADALERQQRGGHPCTPRRSAKG